MKRILITLVMLTLLLPFALPAAAQAPQQIAYGDTVEGEITNLGFETLYTFEGTAGDIVSIELSAATTNSFDPYLYLTTIENQALAENDDASGLDSRIVSQLTADGTYQIVATRREGRAGTGEGTYTLTLTKLESAALGTTLEGTAVYGDSLPIHIFIPAEAGVYSFTYSQVSGNYFPGVTISSYNLDFGYEEDIAQLSGRRLRGGTLILEAEAGQLYTVSIESSFYDFSSTEGDEAVYTLVIDQVAQPAAAQ